MSAPGPVDVARHLGDALRVVRDRTEGVHGDDDADRGQQAGAGEGDGEQRDEHRAREQERAVDGRADDQRGVDGGLEAHRDAGEDDRRRAGERARADVLDRLGLGAGVVARQRQDDDREHDADGDGGERDDLRVAGRGEVTDAGGVDAGQLGEARRQVGERGDRAEHDGDDRGHVEAAVDRPQRVLALAGAGDEHADDRGDDTDRRDDQRVGQAQRAERDRAQDQRGHQHHGVGLEEVRGHAGAVTDVVAHVVGDRRRVAGVVLGDVLLDLADEVGADVGGLGEDAAADTHEHGEQGRAEAEALEHARGLLDVEEHDDRGTEEPEADGGHADHAAGAERDPRALVASARLVGRRGDADVGLRRQVHAQRADRHGEQRADDEGHRAPDQLTGAVGRQREEQQEDDDDERSERLELAGEEGARALLHRTADVTHSLRALVGGEHLPAQDEADDQRDEGDGRHHDDHDVVAGGERDPRGEDGRLHPASRLAPTNTTRRARPRGGCGA